MYLANPALAQALARDHVADLRHSAQASAHGRHAKAPPRVTSAARRRAGWLLVDIGLRLATPSRS
jgi:hypothetical protein